jgi:hypothetical protein
MKAKKETTHFIFYYQKDSTAERGIELIAKVSEESFSKIVKTLKLKKDFPKIKYFLYETNEDKLRATGDEGNANTNRVKFEIHAVYNDEVKAVGPHEIVHLLTNHLGVPSYVLSEGLAESFEDYWTNETNGELRRLNHDDWVKEFLNTKKYIPIVNLFDDSRFWDYDDTISYPESGSFVKYLIKTYGVDKILGLYKDIKRKDSVQKDLSTFRKIIGKELTEVEKDWLRNLN